MDWRDVAGEGNRVVAEDRSPPGLDAVQVQAGDTEHADRHHHEGDEDLDERKAASSSRPRHVVFVISHGSNPEGGRAHGQPPWLLI